MKARPFWLFVLAVALLAVMLFALRSPDRGIAGVDDNLPMPADQPAGVVPLALAEGEPPGFETVPGTLWQAISETSVPPGDVPAYKEVVANRALVRLSPADWRWQTGDTVTIPIPQLGRVYQSTVAEVQQRLGDRRAYLGTLTESDGRRYGFVITAGPRSAFAHLDTPEGTYELVARGELGWLMPSANMDQHVDYSKPDYFIPRESIPGGSSHVED